MAKDTNFIETTEHEAGIIRASTYLTASIKSARWNETFSVWAECKKETESAARGLRVGAIVYANGIYNGIESAALWATYRDGVGWKFADVNPPFVEE